MNDTNLGIEFQQLLHDLRATLRRYQSVGIHAVPGGASPRLQSAALPDPPAASSEAAPEMSPTSSPTASMTAVADAPLIQETLEAVQQKPDEVTDPGLAPVNDPAPTETLEQIRADLGACERCKLAPRRTHIVFGVGDPHAPLMFVGEAPGEQEDLRGEPFVGPAGQLLDRMMAAMGWNRQSVYIANVLKCRPPGNRDPESDEIAACRPFLARQIMAVAPLVIVALGRPASQLLLNTSASLGSLRGRFHEYQGIPVMPTYHPAYLLRNPRGKRATWDDLQTVMRELENRGITPPLPAKSQ